jgi:hypothetical protein
VTVAPAWGLFILGLALFASIALGFVTAYLVVRRTKNPILWVLVPLFTFFWLALGLAPFVFGVRAVRSSPPAPVTAPAGPTAPQP